MHGVEDIQLAITRLPGHGLSDIRAWLETCPGIAACGVREVTAAYDSTPEIAAIQRAVQRLDAEQIRELREWLELMDVETPEMLAAIDEGLRSLDEEGGVPIEEARRRLPPWNGK